MQNATGWILFISAMGMMCTLVSGDLRGLHTWSEAVTPPFIASMMAHLGSVIGAFVGGLLITPLRDQSARTRSSDDLGSSNGGTMKKLICLIVVVGSLAMVSSSCTRNMPPNLTPQAQSAFKNTQAIKALDVLRDFAVDANAATPPILSHATAAKVVDYHESTLKIIHAADTGWVSAVQSSLDELAKNLPPAEAPKLTPYINLVKAVLTGVGQ